MAPTIFHYDYEFSPYGKKTKLLLEAASVDFKRVDQPIVLPRKDLEDLGITYRRIPVLAVGKDVYCDSSLIFDLVVEKLAKDKVPTSQADKAWEAWGYQQFVAVLQLIPHELLSPDFVKDRQTIFPLLARSDYKLMWDSGVAEFHSRMNFIESLLSKNPKPYLNGSQLSVSDIHMIWGIRWGLTDLGVEKKEKGFGKESYPKIWELMESLPEAKPETVAAEEAKKVILGSEYFEKVGGVEKDCPLGIAAGTQVTVESVDSEPGSHPQGGKLLATSVDKVVLELENGIHLHFPRNGYVIKKA